MPQLGREGWSTVRDAPVFADIIQEGVPRLNSSRYEMADFCNTFELM